MRQLLQFLSDVVDDPAVKSAESKMPDCHVSPADVIDCMGDGIIVVDVSGLVIMANEAIGRILRRPVADLVGSPLETLLAEAELLRLVGVQHLLDSQSVDHMQVVFCDQSGNSVPASVTASPLRAGRRRCAGCVLVCRDNVEVQELLNESSRWAAAEIERADRLAEAKTAAEAREQLHMEQGHAQKLESIGQLAAGIAHEINTPIQFIGDNVGFLRKAFELLLPLVARLASWCEAGASDADIEETKRNLRKAKVPFLQKEVPRAIEQTLSGIERVAKIVRAMKDFSHPSGDDMRLVDLHQAIESTVTVARNEWKYVADLETDFDPNLPLVKCLPDGVNQAILNMVVNAAHAIAEAQAQRQVHEKGCIRVTTRSRPPFVEIHIKDTGAGIPEELRERIFDPFFTTKEVGKGTGQGLAIAYSVIVKKHGGSIDLQSTVGQGTTFILSLPINGVASEAPRA